MFWLGILVGGMLGGSGALFIHALFINGKKSEELENNSKK